MIHMVLGIPTLDFYLHSKKFPNVVRFECINNDGEPDPTARFEFRNSTRNLIAQRGTDTSQSYLTYNITEDAVIRCIVGEEHSNYFIFTGKVTMYSISYLYNIMGLNCFNLATTHND